MFSARVRRPGSKADRTAMDTTSAVSLSTASSNYQVQIAVAKKAMDSERAQGDAMVELIKQAAAVGDSLNSGDGGSLDVYA